MTRRAQAAAAPAHGAPTGAAVRALPRRAPYLPVRVLRPVPSDDHKRTLRELQKQESWRPKGRWSVMASVYHPLYSTLWDDPKLEGTSFEAKGFFAYCCTNDRVRPSGIYRMSDQQIAVNTGLPVARVRRYLTDLDRRGLVMRDGSWLWVRGYFKRQPKHENLLRGVTTDLEACASARILRAFAKKYPLVNQRVTDRLSTLGVTVGHPIKANRSTTTTQYKSNTKQLQLETTAKPPRARARTRERAGPSPPSTPGSDKPGPILQSDFRTGETPGENPKPEHRARNGPVGVGAILGKLCAPALGGAETSAPWGWDDIAAELQAEQPGLEGEALTRAVLARARERLARQEHEPEPRARAPDPP